MVELPIEDGPFSLLAQVIAHYAGDLIGRFKDGIQRPELRNPLDGSFFAHLVDPNQVVTRFANKCGNFWILMGLDSVTFLYSRGRVALEFGNTSRARIKHRHALVDQLESVPVSGHDEDVKTLRRPGRRKRGEDVVGFVVFLLHSDNPHGVQGLLKKGDLADELRRGLPPGSFVFGIDPGSKRKS